MAERALKGDHRAHDSVREKLVLSKVRIALMRRGQSDSNSRVHYKGVEGSVCKLRVRERAMRAKVYENMQGELDVVREGGGESPRYGS